MRLKKYSSDLPAVSWQVIKKIIQVRRRSKWELREIVNAVLYVTKNGCVWRDLPGDFPVWQTVYYYYAKWVRDGTWKNISDCLIVDYREKVGKSAQPSVAIIDSQSVKNGPCCTSQIGFDGGKSVKGRKRFYIVDTLGNLLDSFVVAANRYDGTTAAANWGGLALQNTLLEGVRKVFADGTFKGTFSREMEDKHGLSAAAARWKYPRFPSPKRGKLSFITSGGSWKEQSAGRSIIAGAQRITKEKHNTLTPI